MTRLVYIVGYPGSGKSTLFTGVTDRHAPHKDVILRTEMATVRGVERERHLRGVLLGSDGVTLGRVGTAFPGVDGMQRDTQAMARDWLAAGAPMPHMRQDRWILLEGSLLAHDKFMSVAMEHTRLTLLVVTAKDSEARAKARADKIGSDYQKDSWRKGKITQTDKIVNWAIDHGVETLEVTNDIPGQTEDLVDIVEELLYND
ncbi:thymidylate kinase [Microbacterium phage Sinatra]|uniref:Thymidylate kinase n=1 Tax=Microbacterium phage Sinatra TaxID=2591219 RepID=A0A514DGP9_9CAUD|nr:thymidylate kinase [Microbacterium phage Sinatra]